MTRKITACNSNSWRVWSGALALVLLSLFAPIARAVGCKVVQHGPPSDADTALLNEDYEKAAALYQTALAAHPNDPDLTAGLVHALLNQQQVQQAADVVKAAIAASPNVAAFVTLRGEVELRQGEPWAATDTVKESFKLDPCNPRNRLLFSHIALANSLYATSRSQISTAYKLDPDDPEIREAWLDTLPESQRIDEIQSWLADHAGDTSTYVGGWRSYLDHLKKAAADPRKACHLVSNTESTEMPFDRLMYDAVTLRAYALHVKVNNYSALLQIDTGAGGLVLSHAAAEAAGLKPFLHTKIGGVGDENAKEGYVAYVDSIHIGKLEFQDCQVSVLEDKKTIDKAFDKGDGLIGMDVFSDFLVTLDYPLHKLILGPLPPRPGEAAPAPGLQTDGSGQAGPAGSAAAKASPVPNSGQPAASQPIPSQPVSSGPFDRYIAPEMKDYVSVYRVGHDLILPASLNSQTLKLFIMDTGAWATTISPQAAHEVTRVHKDHDDMDIEGLSGKVKKVYNTGDITFHFAHLSQLNEGVYAFDTSDLSKDDGMEISGLIGIETLKLLVIHLDYRDGLVKFDYDPKHGYQLAIQ